MQYLHTMVRVRDLEKSLDFYCRQLGLVEINRYDHERGRFTLVFLAAPGDAEHAREQRAPMVELTYNWDAEDYTGGRNFGHLPAPDGRGRRHQPPAAGRPYGVCALARRYLHRIAAERRGAGAAGALGVHGQYRRVVARPRDKRL